MGWRIGVESRYGGGGVIGLHIVLVAGRLAFRSRLAVWAHVNLFWGTWHTHKAQVSMLLRSFDSLAVLLPGAKLRAGLSNYRIESMRSEARWCREECLL